MKDIRIQLIRLACARFLMQFCGRPTNVSRSFWPQKNLLVEPPPPSSSRAATEGRLSPFFWQEEATQSVKSAKN